MLHIFHKNYCLSPQGMVYIYHIFPFEFLSQQIIMKYDSAHVPFNQVLNDKLTDYCAISIWMVGWAVQRTGYTGILCGDWLQVPTSQQQSISAASTRRRGWFGDGWSVRMLSSLFN